MKKLLFLLLPCVIFAQSFMISNIPIPRIYIQDLDPYACNNTCMRELLDNGQIFSFLSHANKKLTDKDLDEARIINIAVLNLGASNAGAKLKIALLLPYNKIGKYASTTTNATFAYLMTKSNSFMLKSYKIEKEDISDLQQALSQIESDGFDYVIAPLTAQGVNNVIELNPNLNIYFPTINKKDVDTMSTSLIFGGIDYKKQSQMLLHEAVSPLVIFSDKSQTGKKLAFYQEEEFLHPSTDVNDTMFYDDEVSVYSEDTNLTQEKKVFKYFISRRTTNLEKYLKKNEDIVNASFFVNTPIIKTGMILSQLTLYDANATNILSTQINYDPLLLSMTQYSDRKNMIVANSITQDNNVLIETNSLLGNDIVYDWINYTTTVGIDYFYAQITGEDREYNINVSDNQMVYNIKLLRPGISRFFKYTPPQE
ncbi:hypothetical protein [Sulfurimonas autotrophica]|uniref:Periplasmic protein n=1 Tax=Sulfurimonas autotrophica (strain ATCC BAA-671 / DSM 16294 / JCM 11897 / OK10) TaxID=563040 RepID=E0UTJ4_SULAO|nr:hypothetical protein [Sulfurimonas autotrophica]ADN09359.1 conserved hypothetical protein [Sulfurimonas autotrophica DSM 16294]